MFEWIESLRVDAEAGLARGEARVAAEHPFLRDHFPGAPLLPGTLLLELAAQVAGPLAEEVTRRRHGLERYALLALVRHAVFPRPTLLPARLHLQARVELAEPGSVVLRATAAVAAAAGPSGHVQEVELRAALVMAMVEPRPEWDAALRARHERLARWGSGS